MSDFHFLYPWRLLGLLLCVALWFLPNPRLSGWHRLMDKPLAAGLLTGKARHLLRVAPIICACAVIGQAGPSWQRDVPPALALHSDVMIVLDQRPAMYARDLAPDRNQRMQQKIMALMRSQPASRFGLVTWSGSAHLTVPLTRDSDFFALYLQAQSPAIMPNHSGSALRQAVTLAEHSFPPRGAARNIIVITDNLSQQEADWLSQRHTPLQVWAVGSERGGDLPAPWSSRGIDTRLKVAPFLALRDAAISVTLADSGNDDIHAIGDQIHSSAVTQQHSRQGLRWKDSGYLLIIPLLVMVLIFRHQLLVVALVALPLTLHSAPASARWMDWWLTADQQGEMAFNSGSYRQAARRYQDPLWQGIASYYAGDYPQAAASFARAPASPQSLTWLANSYAKQKAWQKALTEYDRALSLDPEYRPAWSNRERVAWILIALRQKERERQQAQGKTMDYDPDGIRKDLHHQQGVRQKAWRQSASSTPQLEQWYDSLALSPADLLSTLYRNDTAEAP
jgi:Ca-activated chloride channel family protein